MLSEDVGPLECLLSVDITIERCSHSLWPEGSDKIAKLEVSEALVWAS
jgi:hypothetical protein